MLGKKSFCAGNKPASPMDYDIDSNDICDMAVIIRDLCADADSEWGIELAESTNKTETLKNIVIDYVNTNVLGLSKDENGKLIELPTENGEVHVETIDDVPDGFTFDPTVVSAWTALSENENSIVSTQKMISAMKGMGLTEENVVGKDNRNSTIAGSLITFNEKAAKSKDDFAEGSFERKILEHTESHLANLGITATCRLDDNGLIDIVGEARGILNNKENNIPVHAQIGQIFAPDEHNVIHVKRNNNDDFGFIPGYRAFIEEDDGSGKTMQQRTLLYGYFDAACESINESLSSVINFTCRAMESKNNTNVDVSLPTACNYVYGTAYGTRIPADHFEN
jgi:hypothetical protein